ncbi:MAG: response regulator [Verrucomicrobiales bacterium]
MKPGIMSPGLSMYPPTPWRRRGEFKPDIILLDVVMPGLDGGDISAALKQDPVLSKVPVLIITALVSNDETGENAVISSGDQVMIAKPIRLEVLTKAIEDRMAGVL